jgi:hypothetical protein
VTEEKHNPESGQDPEITKLYRAGRTEEPSTAVDKHILGQARRTARHNRRRWLVPLSSAAVVLLGLTLTLQLVEHEPEHFDINDYLPNEAPAPEKEQLEKKQKAAPVLQAPAPLMEKEESLRFREMAPSEYNARPAASGSSTPEPMMEEASPARMKSGPVLSPATDGAAAVEPPEKWLARIMSLNEQGETQTATEELARFRRHYPEYPVPDTLKNLLPEP